MPVMTTSVGSILAGMALLGAAGAFLHKYHQREMAAKLRLKNGVEPITQIDYEMLRQHLLSSYDDASLANETRPIMWIYTPGTLLVRGPAGDEQSVSLVYQRLNAMTILKHCGKSFRVCFFDDVAFGKLIPGWPYDLTKCTFDTDRIRRIGMAQILYLYGGIQVPLDFLCMRDLYGMMQGRKRAFVVENRAKTYEFDSVEYAPNPDMMGAPKRCGAIADYIRFLEDDMKRSYGSLESKFDMSVNMWMKKSGKFVVVSSDAVGVRGVTEEKLLTEEAFIISTAAYGIWIPGKSIAQRTRYDWFSTMPVEDILTSNFALAKYYVLALAPK
jgi:hypothetical protein